MVALMNAIGKIALSEIPCLGSNTLTCVCEKTHIKKVETSKGIFSFSMKIKILTISCAKNQLNLK